MWFIHGGKIMTTEYELGEQGRNIRHFVLKDRTGKLRHFRRVFDFLPPPLCYLVFIGKFETSGNKGRKRIKGE